MWAVCAVFPFKFPFDDTTWEGEYRTQGAPFDGSEPLNGGTCSSTGVSMLCGAVCAAVAVAGGAPRVVYMCVCVCVCVRRFSLTVPFGFQFDDTTWEGDYRTHGAPFDGSNPLNGGPS